MAFARFPKNHYERNNSSHFAKEDATVVEAYEAPGDAPKGKGRFIIFTLLSLIFFALVFFVWDSFVRWEAYGVVDANVVGVYSPVEGQVTMLHVAPGIIIDKNDFVARVENKDDIRALQKVRDEIRVVQAELAAKDSSLGWSLAQNNEVFHKAMAELTAQKGNLGEYKARLNAAYKNLKRVRHLNKMGAASQREIEQNLADVQTYKARIAGTEETIAVMEKRLNLSKQAIDDKGESQLSPLKQRLVYLQNEEKRLAERVADGKVRSPITGKVVKINSFAGEMVKDDSLFEVVQENTARIVLYYSTDDKLPKEGDRMQVYIPAVDGYTEAVVTGYSNDAESAPPQIERFYDQKEKLVQVYVQPTEIDIDRFIVGMEIRKPTGLEFLSSWLLSEKALATLHGEK